MLHRLLCLLLALTLLGLAPLRGALAQPPQQPDATAQASQGMPCHEAAPADVPVKDLRCCPLCGDGACALCASCATSALAAWPVRVPSGEPGREPWSAVALVPWREPAMRVPHPPPRRPL